MSPSDGALVRICEMSTHESYYATRIGKLLRPAANCACVLFDRYQVTRGTDDGCEALVVTWCGTPEERFGWTLVCGNRAMIS